MSRFTTRSHTMELCSAGRAFVLADVNSFRLYAIPRMIVAKPFPNVNRKNTIKDNYYIMSTLIECALYFCNDVVESPVGLHQVFFDIIFPRFLEFIGVVNIRKDNDRNILLIPDRF